MKRITSVLLAMVLLLSMAVIPVPVAAVETFDTSDECIALLKAHEGFCKYPVWDYSQYTVGYGTRCPSDMLTYYLNNGITEEEAETLLRNYLDAFEKEINEKVILKHGLTLTQNQFDALVSFSYNCGTAWAYSETGTFYQAIVNGWTGNDLVRAFALWCSAGNEVKTFLLNRRLSEANMYLNGIYDQNPPAQYCYVLYNANGGTTSPRTQGYSTEWEATPYPVPVYEGHTFEGWYTSRSGGAKVEKLDASHDGKTLYAHWTNSSGESVAPEEGVVTVTVTGTDVNVRSGPGTNYTKVTIVTKGDVLDITETCDAGGYTWGKFDQGWLALQYTDYDKVIHENPVVPPQTEPEVTEPEPEATEPVVTEPKETEPEVTEPTVTEPTETEPKETEPEVTEPKETEPEATEPETNKVTGTVNVSDWLRVRSGPSTGYSVVEYLKPKQKVEILEQKVVGATKWGRISTGWISMDYVILDETESGTPTDGNTDSTGSASSGTIVNCTTLRIRSGPGTNYSIAGFIGVGTKVTFSELKQVGSVTWGKISEGWISLDYVRLDSAGTGGNTGSTTTEVTGTVNVNQFLRVRQGPGTSYAVVAYMNPNERVEITEQRTVGSTKWGKTAKGWISMEYVILDNTQSGTTGDTTGGTTGSDTTTGGDTATGTAEDYGTINVNQSLNIRQGAGTSYPVVGTYGPKVRVEILEQKTVGYTKWARTDKGWISMDYVILESTGSSASASGKVMTIIADCLNVRENPGVGNAIVGYLYYGAKVTVLETKTVNGTEWGRIANGWISLDYAK